MESKNDFLVKSLTLDEQQTVSGGVIVALAVGLATVAVGYMAIGAKVCWDMAIDNRE